MTSTIVNTTGQKAAALLPKQALYRGRGAATNESGRFEILSRSAFDDGWADHSETLPPLRTDVQTEHPRKIITANNSPDLGFSQSINPYRGCEHGCSYCYARPSHAYMGLSAGLDFETKLFAKPDAAKLLERELSKPGYEVRPIALGTNTDPYQPIEKQYRIVREILEILEAHQHPVVIVTKSALVRRDMDILSRMAAKGLASVAISVTSLDRKLSRRLEPRAATPSLRLETLKALNQTGIPTRVMVAPIIPALNDFELERILESATHVGTKNAGYIVLRLPREVSPLFRDWLKRHYPDRHDHVIKLVQSMRGGKDYDAKFNNRMRGTGPYAWQIRRRFELTCKRLELDCGIIGLRSDLFRSKKQSNKQLNFFHEIGALT